MSALIPILQNSDGIPAMSSLTIAEITGKDHRNVTADIERILAEAEIDALGFKHIYRDSQNRQQKCYILPRRECDLVVSGYSVKYRLAIIDRWHDLEARQSFHIPQTLSDALRLAADLSDQVTAAKAELLEAAPKVSFYDAVTASDTVCQMAVAAQVAGLPFGRNTLLQRLREEGILISGGERHNLPKQRFIEQGLFTVKEHKIENPKTGEPIINFSTHVTQKGISWLVQRYGKPQMEAAISI